MNTCIINDLICIINLDVIIQMVDPRHILYAVTSTKCYKLGHTLIHFKWNWLRISGTQVSFEIYACVISFNLDENSNLKIISHIRVFPVSFWQTSVLVSFMMPRFASISPCNNGVKFPDVLITFFGHPHGCISMIDWLMAIKMTLVALKRGNTTRDVN